VFFLRNPSCDAYPYNSAFTTWAKKEPPRTYYTDRERTCLISSINQRLSVASFLRKVSLISGVDCCEFHKAPQRECKVPPYGSSWHPWQIHYFSNYIWRFSMWKTHVAREILVTTFEGCHWDAIHPCISCYLLPVLMEGLFIADELIISRLDCRNSLLWRLQKSSLQLLKHTRSMAVCLV